MKRHCSLLFVLLGCFVGIQLPAAEMRRALVMGVWQYTDPTFPSLPGIESDVSKMSAKLKSLGFTVTVATNPTLGAAKKAVDDFGAELLASKGTGLFYFSGHGCENDGKNYLIPHGTSIRTRGDLDDEALSAQRVLTRMEEAGTTVNLVFLDCCRNALTKGVGDLAPMRATGTFIGFATASAAVAGASDEGSAYTAALLENLGTPGVSILDMHTLVTKRVKEMTQGTQVPFQYSGLDVPFALVPVGLTPPAPVISLSMSEAEMQRRIEDEVKRRMNSTVVPPSGGSGNTGRAQMLTTNTNDPAKATKSTPFVNSLGMKFVPVPGTKVLFCVHETRREDYAAYAKANNGVDASWKGVTFKGVPVSNADDHPVVNVSLRDGAAFCTWLGRKEGRTYRVPTDHEWSCAVGIGFRENESISPESKDAKIAGVYPWGGDFPPAGRAGNYADRSTTPKFTNFTLVPGYMDGYPTTSPVMSFDSNQLGIFDLGGNVWEFCSDWYNVDRKYVVLRGGSWRYGEPDNCLSSIRFRDTPVDRDMSFGFRCVLVVPTE